MGIRGLTSFIDKHYVWHSVPISSIERLVIDGNNLCYNLYRRNGLEWSLGGDYPGLFEIVKTFFKKLQGLHIGLYVILDGIDYKGEKTATVRQRKLQSYERIRKNQTEHKMGAANGRSASEDGVLPLLGRMVFIDALREAGVTYLIADEEADAEIVAVANFYQCPVLADDSDFYMFNIKEGYFPLHHFFRALEGAADCRAKKYRVTDFADQFLHRIIDLRLLIPAILGNDFLKRVVYPGLDNPETIIHCISRHSTSEDFLDKMPDTVDQKSLRGNFSKAAALYDAELRKDPQELSEVTNLHLPKWLLNQYREGRFAQRMVSAIMTHKCILPAVVDDIMSQSSHWVSEKIRQCIYGILIQHVESVQETVRNKAGTCLHDKRTEPLRLNKSEPLTLNKIRDQKTSSGPSLQLTKNFCHVLYCQKSVHRIKKLHEKWRLVSASLIYWYRNAEPTPSYYLVEALVQCFIICDSGSSDLIPLSQADWKFSHQDFLEALHAFAQWQCTYNDAVALNQLLQEPFKYISPACLYSGKVAMHCASLCSQSQMHSFTPEQCEEYESLMNLIPTKPKDDTPARLVDKEPYATGATQTVTFTHPNRFEVLQEQSPSESKKK